jgi:hypothetical protein
MRRASSLGSTRTVPPAQGAPGYTGQWPTLPSGPTKNYPNLNNTTLDRIECFPYLKLCANYTLKFKYSFNYVFLYIPIMTRPKRRISTTGEEPEERIRDATELYLRLRDSQPEISIRLVAKRHRIPWESVCNRVKGVTPRKKAMEDFQKLI